MALRAIRVPQELHAGIDWIVSDALFGVRHAILDLGADEALANLWEGDYEVPNVSCMFNEISIACSTVHSPTGVFDALCS